jgi:hypothetical protein
MKYLLLILILSACTKSFPTPSDELILTSQTCVVQYTIYRITSHPTDSLEFVLKDILDCRYQKERRHRISPGFYELQITNTTWTKKIRFWKKAVKFGLLI